MRLKFVFVPMGSAGDVHPILWLARLMRQRGHDVTLVVQAAVKFLAERSGLPFTCVGDADEQNAVIRNPDLWHPRKAFNLLASYMPIYARELIPAIEKEIEPDRTVLVGGTIAFAARIVAERFDVPMLSIHLQPSIMMSVEDSPVMMAGWEWMPKAPRWVRRALFGMINWKVDRAFSKPLGRVRREVGIPGPSPTGIMRDWCHSPDGAICLFPEWFAAKAADWPAQAVLTRFPLYDEADVLAPDPAAAKFLAAGEPPVVVTPGSANAQAARFLQEAALACQRLNRRAMLLTRYPEQVPANLPASIRAFEYLPFGRVFPHAAAVIHHGGVGTTSQCLAAGVPQLIMPMAHDQPDNAVRIKRLGVGDYLYPRAFKAARIAAKLSAIMASPAIRQAAAACRQKITEQMPASEMAKLVEAMSQKALHERRASPAAEAA